PLEASRVNGGRFGAQLLQPHGGQKLRQRPPASVNRRRRDPRPSRDGGHGQFPFATIGLKLANGLMHGLLHSSAPPAGSQTRPVDCLLHSPTSAPSNAKDLL